MPLQSASIQSGATWSSTGGSALSLAPDGRIVTDGVRLIVTADTNLLTRRSVVAKSVLPVAAPKAGVVSRLGKNQMVYFIPFVAGDGLTYNQSIQIIMNLHHEYTEANRRTAKTDAGALLLDSDFDDFWVKSLLT